MFVSYLIPISATALARRSVWSPPMMLVPDRWSMVDFGGRLGGGLGILRAGIQSVSHGQTEASQALGLSRRDTVRLVTIPQALRVIIPPTISQYLNLTKNSSLAVAVGYEELVAVWAGITLNQTGQALVIIGMTVAVYECLSLFTSFVLNWYNKRIQLTER